MTGFKRPLIKNPASALLGQMRDMISSPAITYFPAKQIASSIISLKGLTAVFGMGTGVTP